MFSTHPNYATPLREALPKFFLFLLFIFFDGFVFQNGLKENYI